MKPKAWRFAAAALAGSVAAAHLLSGTVGGSSPADAADGTQKPVLELYTSQGCSSCPPADALLRRYIERGDVIALSVAVDYWDRLGWKDSFGSRANSDRQRAYAISRGDGQVYTPQMVINGRAHAIGSVASSIDKALANTNRALNAASVPLTAKLDDGGLVVQLGKARPGAGAKPANLLLALVQDEGTVNIKRGENSGRKITYHNVVRKFESVGSWTGSAKAVRVPRTKLDQACCESAVVMLQQVQGGPILAATKVSLR